jgi:hypothetical protein
MCALLKTMLFATVLLWVPAGSIRAGAVDHFDRYALGQADVVTSNWKAMPEGLHTAVVATDPADSSNKVLQLSTFSTALQGNGIYGILPAGAHVAEGEVKTLFLRFCAAATTTNQSFGLTDVDAPVAGGGGNWGDFRVQVGVIDGDLRVRDGDNMRTLRSITPGTWYNIWIVVNSATDRLAVYLNEGTGDAAETDRQSSGTIDIFAFRSPTGQTLDRFLWRAQPRTTNPEIRIDNIYVADGFSLENPRAFFAAAALTPDVNADQYVDSADLAAIAEAWLEGCSEPKWCGGADINKSGSVEMRDFELLSRGWLRSTIDGLAAWWTFDEPAGMVVYDTVAEQHGLLYHTEPGDRVVTGQGYGLGLDSQVESDGLGEYAHLPCVARNDFTISFWMRTNQFAPDGPHWWYGMGMVDAVATGVRNDFGVSLLRDKAAFGVNGPGFGDVTIRSASAVNDGYWHHIAATRDSASGEINLYIDGIRQAAGLAAPGPLNGPSRMLVGSVNLLGGRYFRGYFDDLRVYSRVLDPEEIFLVTQRDFAPVTPKKGVGNKTLYKINHLNVCWFYNWGVNKPSSPDGVDSSLDYVPMKWGKNSITLDNSGYVNYLLGFNEPDLASQANMTVAEALAQWPQLQAMADAKGLLLGSPAVSHYSRQWIKDFMAAVDAPGSGLRVDFMAVHWYSSPDADLLMNNLTWVHDTWGRDVWLTEFNVAKWDGDNPWTQEQSYTFLAEALYRMEKTSWIKRYAIFPWEGTTTNSKASPIFEPGSENLTPLGRLYASWEGDVRGPQPDTFYFVHNKASHRRLSVEGTNVRTATIFDMNGPEQWEIVDAQDDGVFLQNRTGKRLGFNLESGQFFTADPVYTGDDVKWKLTPALHGWYFIDHAAGSRRLSRSGESITSVSNTIASDNERWRFIKI